MDSAQKRNPGDDEAKNSVQDKESLRQLLEQIDKLELSGWMTQDTRKVIASIATNSAGSERYLNHQNIGDAGAAAIIEGLKMNDTLTSLNLEDNNIGDAGAAAIGEGLRKNATLRTLVLDNNNIGDVGAAAIGEGLGKNDALTELYLDDNHIGDAGAAAIGEGLSKNATLTTLYLNDNNIKHHGFLGLAKGFRLNKQLTILFTVPKGTNHEYPMILSEIGRGAFGSVSLAKTATCAEVVQKKSLDGSTREETYEKLILQGLPQHENVVRLAGFSTEATLLLDAHKGGSLREYSRKHEGAVPLSQFLIFSGHMALAIEHLHKHGLVHRDIAQRNYVITGDLKTAVLVDFGLSWPIDDEKSVAIRPGELMPFRQCPPEVFTTMQYSKSADIWQLGLAYWQFLHRGRQPFSYISNGQQLAKYLNKKMGQEKRDIPLSFKKNGAPQQLIAAVKSLVVFCCAYDPDERPTATEVIEKIESLGVPSAAEVKPDEEKSYEYQPDESAVVSGLNAYNYTDYQSLDTGGQSDYIDLKKDLEEHEYEQLETFPESDEEDVGDDEPAYHKMKPLDEAE